MIVKQTVDMTEYSLHFYPINSQQPRSHFLLDMQKRQGRSPAIVIARDLPWGMVSGGVLLSHTVAGAVPSALKGLASGFGMDPGVSPPL